MGIYETYTKRLRKRERAGQPDVYQYEELPEALRKQIVHIWRGTLGHHCSLWDGIHEALPEK